MRLFFGSSVQRLTVIVGTIERAHLRRGIGFELSHGVTLDVSPKDRDELISIRAILFVIEANGMQKFMDDRRLRYTTRTIDRQILSAIGFGSSQVGPTAIAKRSS